MTALFIHRRCRVTSAISLHLITRISLRSYVLRGREMSFYLSGNSRSVITHNACNISRNIRSISKSAQIKVGSESRPFQVSRQQRATISRRGSRSHLRWILHFTADRYCGFIAWQDARVFFIIGDVSAEVKIEI